MTPAHRRGDVVVGVGGHSSGAAVDWAAAEAAARRSPLVVVHAFRRPLEIDPYGLIPVVAGPPVAPTAAEQLLCTAVRRARSVAPELEVFAELHAGAPSRILLERTRRAALLVLGGRGAPGVGCLVGGSIAGMVAARAWCPLVVKRADSGVRSGRSCARVVVGVSGTGSCSSAVGFAFRAASQRGIPLTAVHAWRGDPPARRALDRELSHWREQFVDVPVESILSHAAPTTALIEESAGAALIVVGSGGRRPVMARLRGSVSRTVLLRAQSAVAVVRPERASRNSPAGSRGHRRSVTDAA